MQDFFIKQTFLNFKRLFTLACLILFIATGWAFLLWQQENKNIVEIFDKKNYIRLHILANSDSLADQTLKLKVRDRIIFYLTPLVKDVKDVKEAKKIVAERQADILNVAKETLALNGADYPVSMEIGDFYFPLRTYGTLILPEGEYQAVRLYIGEGSGQNWWCVLFPPLCFIDGSAINKEPADTKDNLEHKPKIRWKIAELLKAN